MALICFACFFIGYMLGKTSYVTDDDDFGISETIKMEHTHGGDDYET